MKKSTMSLILSIIISMIMVSCATTKPKDVQPLVTISQADINHLVADIQAADKAVQALPIWKERQNALNDYKNKIDPIIKASEPYKEWSAKQSHIDKQIMATDEYKRLVELKNKLEDWNAVLNGGKK